MAERKSSYSYHANPKHLWLYAVFLFGFGVYSLIVLANFHTAERQFQWLYNVITINSFLLSCVPAFYAMQILRNPPQLNLYDIGFSIPRGSGFGHPKTVRYAHISRVSIRHDGFESIIEVKHRAAKKPAQIKKSMMNKRSFGELFTILDYSAQNPDSQLLRPLENQLRVLCEICDTAIVVPDSEKLGSADKKLNKIGGFVDLCSNCALLTPKYVRIVGIRTILQGVGLVLTGAFIGSLGYLIPQAWGGSPLVVIVSGPIGFGILALAIGIITLATRSLRFYPKGWIPTGKVNQNSSDPPVTEPRVWNTVFPESNPETRPD